MGGVGKCTPPFRSIADRGGPWRLLIDGMLPMVVSDHSPSSLDLKRGDDFFKLWGGISERQSTSQLLLASGPGDWLDLTAVASGTARNQARRFGLSGKGEIAVGFDADLWLVDLSYQEVVRAEELFYRNRFGVHEGLSATSAPSGR